MKRDERRVALRCAVYTRVSTNSGLEQDFNSLDNQREASEAYVKSQAHEGWKLVRERYDDGGFSGGSMERPALLLRTARAISTHAELLEDVRARRIDVVVVYKVDRLTRSLADFAKLVELFDAHGVWMGGAVPLGDLLGGPCEAVSVWGAIPTLAVFATAMPERSPPPATKKSNSASSNKSSAAIGSARVILLG